MTDNLQTAIEAWLLDATAVPFDRVPYKDHFIVSRPAIESAAELMNHALKTQPPSGLLDTARRLLRSKAPHLSDDLANMVIDWLEPAVMLPPAIQLIADKDQDDWTTDDVAAVINWTRSKR